MKSISYISMIALALSTILFSGATSDFDYDKAWKAVEQDIQKGLPKSALEKVEAIYKVAQSENDSEQIIKSTLYKTRLTLDTEELGLEKVITDLETAVSESSSPTKQILQSYVAEIFQSYYQSQYYRLAGRTDMADFVPTDMRTWAPNHYREFIAKTYLASLEGRELRITSTGSLKQLLRQSDDAVDFELRPKLYDLLLDRALGYFSQTRIQGLQPSFRFTMAEAQYLAKAQTFQTMKITSEDPSSMVYQGIKLYQSALERNEINPVAHTDYNLKRLQYVRQYGTVPDADEVYFKTILDEIEAASDDQSKINYRFAKAEILSQRGEYTLAVAEYESLLKAKLTVDEKAKAENALQQIHMQDLGISAELVYTPAEKLLFKVDYRNLDEAYLRIVKLSEKDIERLTSRRYNETKNPLRDAKPVHTWKVDFPTDTAYQRQSIEAVADALPLGVYAIVLSNDMNFRSVKDAYYYSMFHVSNIGYVINKLPSADLVVVTDRNTGQPIPEVEIDVYESSYNRDKRETERIFRTTLQTDKKGKVFVELGDAKRNNLVLTFRQGADELDLNTSTYVNRNNRKRNERFATEIFTDRAIYRPGQTVHWKILSMKMDKYGKPAINTGKVANVRLNDANGQKVTDVDITTNAYGSASGSFVIPTGLLTGNFTLSDGRGSKRIRVEEYKRPKFEVNLDKVEAKVRLGEVVKITGMAKALSGAAVTDGKVSYTVTRYSYYGWWSWYRRSPSSTVQMTTGEEITTADGTFEFEFVAQGEANADIKSNPTYRYEVKVDVTDVAGETRTITESVTVAILPYSYVISLGTVMEKEDLKELSIAAKNSNGQGVSSEGTLVVTELIQPEKWQKGRYWAAAGTATIGGSEWDRSFDKRLGLTDQNLASYKKGKVVHTAEIKLVDGELTYDIEKHIKAGKSYEISLSSKEMYESTVRIESIQRFAVKNSEKGKLPPLKLLYVDGTDEQWRVGKAVEIQLGTPDESLEVYYYFMRDWEVVKSGLVTVDDNTSISYTPVEADHGGISLHMHYGKHNRAIVEKHNVQIPWTEKELQVELVTQRDKVLPGAKETWTVKIKGEKADKVAAEMVAAMYDASLDQFSPHSFNFNYYPSHFGYLNTSKYGYSQANSQVLNYEWNRVQYQNVNMKYAPTLLGVDYYGYMQYTTYMNYDTYEEGVTVRAYKAPLIEMDNTTSGSTVTAEKIRSLPLKKIGDIQSTNSGISRSGDLAVRGSREKASEYYIDGERVESENTPIPPQITARKNLNETVFFYPHLQTDKDGNVLINFTMNEALTKWKLLTFAHDKELRYGMTSHEVKTQKDLMIVPNAPRFLREGDRLVFPATVSNLTDKDMTANTLIELVDPQTGKSIDQVFGLSQTQKSVDVPSGESARVEWEINVPKDYKSLVKYTVKAWAGAHTDGEENVLPVVTNQMMVTETEVLSVRKFEEKTFTIDALSKGSATMIPYAFTLEYTSNPVWYAVQALPYIMEYPHECTEQVFNRYYANTLATHIANANPRIQAIFDVWKAKDSDALISNLEKNEELKYALLEESPWIRQAQSETEQKKRIALLFDLNQMASESAVALRKLKERQLPDGSFPWFTGGRGDEYITQVVVMGIAHLERLGVLQQEKGAYDDMIKRAMEYLDERSKYRYDRLVNKSADHLDYRSIQYLYIRSFYPDRSFLKGSKVAYDYYFGQAKKYWLGKGLYSEGIIGIAMLRAKEQTAQDIKASLTERSFYSEELGRYWNMGSSYMWYQLPIETHAKLIEFFTEADEQGDFVENTKIWLLKNKQTNHWKTTKATADAIYALLLQGEDGKMISWIEETNGPDIKLGNTTLEIAKDDMEAGTGYIKKRYAAAEITADMQSVTIKNNSETIGWGATYYQYFEELDQIKSYADNPLTMQKKLYKEVASDYGPKLVELNAGDDLAIGDRVISRIDLKVDRDMSYVHLKDMRPSGFEPENVLSQYKWQDGIGYYESTRDLATNFFISHLRKGTYVFEYPTRVVHKGDFSSGIATLQCMYAPEFTSHSEGVRVEVK